MTWSPQGNLQRKLALYGERRDANRDNLRRVETVPCEVAIFGEMALRKN
jgi:hypothetical protein